MTDEPNATEVLPAERKGPQRRVRQWCASDIARFFEAKANTAAQKGPEWSACLYIDGQLASIEELRASPPGVDVQVCVGRAGSSPLMTQFFELTASQGPTSQDQLVAMSGEVRQILVPLVGVFERLSAQYMALLDTCGGMAEKIRKSMKGELKAHKKMRKAEKRTIDTIAEQDKGASAVVNALGSQLGREGFERVLTGATGDILSFVSEKLAPAKKTRAAPSKKSRKPKKGGAK